jgi:hypothetical protein
MIASGEKERLERLASWNTIIPTMNAISCIGVEIFVIISFRLVSSSFELNPIRPSVYCYYGRYYNLIRVYLTQFGHLLMTGL